MAYIFQRCLIVYNTLDLSSVESVPIVFTNNRDTGVITNFLIIETRIFVLEWSAFYLKLFA